MSAFAPPLARVSCAMASPRDEIKELIRSELDDAMRFSYSPGKVDRIAPDRAEPTTEKIMHIIYVYIEGFISDDQN